MDAVSTAINAGVVAAVGFILAWIGRGRFDALDRRIDRLEERFGRRFDGVEARFDGVEARFDGLEGRFDRRIDGLQASIDATRSDLTQVALAVGVRPRAANP